MKTKRIIILIVILTIILTSCDVAQIKTFSVNENELVMLDVNDYINADIEEINDNLVFYKPLEALTKVYPEVSVESIEIDPKLGGVQAIDEEGNFIMCIGGNNDINEGIGIYKYNLKTQEAVLLIKPQEGNNCAVLFIQGDYLVWMEDENANWSKTKNHIYNMKTNENVMYYQNTRNPETGLTYAWPFNTPVLIEDKIYFDDIVDIDSEGFYKIQLFSYDINSTKIELLYNNAKWPMEYKGELAWLNMSEDKENSVFCTEESGLYKSVTKLGTVYNSTNDLITLNDFLTQNEFERITGKGTDDLRDDLRDELERFAYGVKIIRNGEITPLFVASWGYATNIDSKGNWIRWGAGQIGLPMFYDVENDKLLYVDYLSGINVYSYGLVLSKNKILVSYSEVLPEDSSDFPEQKYLLISFN